MPIPVLFWHHSGIGIAILKIENSRIAILELFLNWVFWNYSRRGYSRNSNDFCQDSRIANSLIIPK
jgi:hypothetical protein